MVMVIYMVGGISSRFGGKIKQFAKVGPSGETLIEYSINQALKAGFNKIIFIVGGKTEPGFREKFGDNYQGIPVYYAYQDFDREKRDRPWGTGDSLCCAKDLIIEHNEPFVVLNGDDIYGENSFKILHDHLTNNDEDATLGFRLTNTLPDEGEVHRGIFEVQDGYVLDNKEVLNISKINLHEKNLTPDSHSSMNIFGLFPRTVVLLDERLQKFKEENQEERGKEFYINVELANLIKEGKIKMRIHPTDERWIGITNPEDEDVVREMLRNMP